VPGGAFPRLCSGPDSPWGQIRRPDTLSCRATIRARRRSHISILLAISIFHVPANLGYGILFALILIESAGVPVPGETSLIAAGVLASEGHLSLPIVFAVAISAAVIGDNLGYLVGRSFGHRLLTRPGRWERQRLQFLDEGEHFFSRHGGKTVFFGRWLPVLRFTAALLAGVNEMPWRRFFVFNLAGATGWVCTVGSAAYLLGSSASNLFEAIGLAGLLALALSIAGHIVWRRSQRGREPRVRRPTADLNDAGE
jgi:membrane protein DedA with SNARE-associated domain